MDNKWKVTVIPLARGDIIALKKNDPDAYEDMMSAFDVLTGCPNIFDIRKPYDICLTYPDAEDCVRFKRRGGKWRVIMRFTDGDIQIKPSKHLRPSNKLYLQIIFVDERTNNTYKNLRIRVANIART